LIDALDEVYTSYPNATFLFVVRETEGWLNSIQSYHDGFIMDVWKRCKTRGFPNLDGTLDDFRAFYEWHKDMIRTFAREHPSWTYIEVDLEAPATGQILQDKVGIDASCWGHYNQQGKDNQLQGTKE
jgi:Sulfotransferase domain